MPILLWRVWMGRREIIWAGCLAWFAFRCALNVVIGDRSGGGWERREVGWLACWRRFAICCVQGCDRSGLMEAMN